MPDSLKALFHLQEKFQRHLYKGTHPKDFNNADKSEYIRTMILALQDELHEAMAEVAWKPWATDKSKFHRDPFIRELVDALHFLINLFLAAGATPDEVAQVFMDKHEVNLRRQDEGYDGTTGKCPCGRALDDYPYLLHVMYDDVRYHSIQCPVYPARMSPTGRIA